ncbi:MAG: hypothetical protein H6812_05855 [Phycisphaeraceae bacterium]|nr:hypothetical protein [Phycisphaerales bacterium]MCB9842768.1 hypothetical protein [Phycisphaeraceae bacterium]
MRTDRVPAALLALSLAATAGATTYTTDIAGNIPDNDAVGFLSPIAVQDNFPITSIKVTIRGLQHNYSSDLTITLKHAGVSSETILVSNLNSGEDADFDGDYAFADSGASLSAVAGPICCTDNIPSGTYTATISLDAKYIGENAHGAWVLRIYDDDFLVAGSFASWEIELGGGPDCPPGFEGDVNHDNIVNVDDLNIILGNWGRQCQ